MKPVFGYVRVSGKSQVDRDGPKRQIRAIRRYAKEKNLEIVEVFEDLGVSGTLGLAERPGLSELMERILSNGVTTILLEKADRLARDVVESEIILREFRKAGVKVIDCEGKTNLCAGDGNNPSEKLIRQMLAVLAEWEKDSIVMKLRAARARKRRETGRCEGVKPFGHFEGEEETLARLRILARKRNGKGRSMREVAEVANSEGLTTRSGVPWTGPNVDRLLSASRKRRA